MDRRRDILVTRDILGGDIARKRSRPRQRAADVVPGWVILFRGFSLRIASRLNAVCNTACSVDKASDGKLRSAVHIQTTQVTGYVGGDETRERAIFQIDTVP